MIYTQLGKSDLTVSRLCLGAMSYGLKSWRPWVLEEHEGRPFIKRALELGASALILVHNHPSGDPSPSAADITVTQDIIKAAASLHILVHDHLIIGRGGHVSLRDRGLILSEVKDAGSSTSASSHHTTLNEHSSID